MRVGSLFTGYGGLDMAVGGELVWYAEIEKAACQVLAAHHPGILNLGNITAINWADVEPVDILTGGYPCQPFSHAGKRKGKNDERHLWPYVLDAICAIRPRYAILENVSGHISLGFADVLADLAKVGMSAQWGTYRASDVGAPHRRERLFIVAYAKGERSQGSIVSRLLVDSERIQQRTAQSDSTTVFAHANSQGLQRHDSRDGETPTTGHGHDQQGLGSLATYTSSNGHGEQLHAGAMAGVEGQTESHPQQRERSRRESDPRGADNAADTALTLGGESVLQGTQQAQLGGHARTFWGKYAPAIGRWEFVLNRPAPAPTVERNERRRLNPKFVEWMMGLPDGWVTGHGLSAAQELKMLGNGVVPQQARAAITQLMQRVEA